MDSVQYDMLIANIQAAQYMLGGLMLALIVAVTWKG